MGGGGGKEGFCPRPPVFQSTIYIIEYYPDCCSTRDYERIKFYQSLPDLLPPALDLDCALICN